MGGSGEYTGAVIAQSLLSTMLMFAPSAVAPPEFDSLTSVDTIEDGDAQIVGYDATGAVVGSIAVWKDSR